MEIREFLHDDAIILNMDAANSEEVINNWGENYLG